MLNNKNRKEAEALLKNEIKKYDETQEHLISSSEKLYKARVSLKKEIDTTLLYINLIKNTPEVLKTEIREIKISMDNYNEFLLEVEKEAKKIAKQSGGSAALGAAGVGVAVLGPTAAMGIATTFGVASTGTAISALSGAAATNAALAWLGGGAVAAGGAGMAGGSALLALAGPVGWSIAATSFLASGFLMNNKNKKIMAEMNKQRLEINGQIKVSEGLITEVETLKKATNNHAKYLRKVLKNEAEEYGVDYSAMTEDQKYGLGTIVNNLFSAVKSLSVAPGENLSDEEADEIVDEVECIECETNLPSNWKYCRACGAQQF